MVGTNTTLGSGRTVDVGSLGSEREISSSPAPYETLPAQLTQSFSPLPSPGLQYNPCVPFSIPRIGSGMTRQ
ncbi:hypothetical protein BO99DRAFT_406764 [Aspergillus violaceofuscus CBS 115571]|uniref:Uncharacterized protein n=1 Tax=Aspergillus violaceofuscus (strain CBS 115571) TaxID=1450538 RepID=A0A2V5I406_ASPV1|nr:hypothetical protein BO99DRAFT_406764 [Aspergillus violaceofuscus CBS 115571]